MEPRLVHHFSEHGAVSFQAVPYHVAGSSVHLETEGLRVRDVGIALHVGGLDERLVALGSADYSGPGYIILLDDNGLTQYRNSDTPDDTDVFSVPWTGTATFSHVVFTLDGDTLKVYLNGVESGSQKSYVSLLDTSYPLVIGEFFDGVLDELAIYEHALTAARIKAHYRAGTGN